MKTRNILKIEAMAMFALAIVPMQAEEIPVPNGSFELIYKPGSTTVTADTVGGWTNGVGPGTPMEKGQTATYSDGTTGTSVDIPGWVNATDRPNAYEWTQGSGVVTRQNGNAPDGDYYFAGNGSNWGVPQGGAVESAAPLTTVTTAGGALSYTVSMLVNGAILPVYLELLADGVPLIPSSSMDPGAPYSWTQVSKTYDADSLADHLGAALTVRVGWGPDASGTQSQLDVVTLSYTPGNSANFPLTISAADPGYLLEWVSQDGMRYNVWSTPDPSESLEEWDLEEGNIEGSETGFNTKNVNPAVASLYYRVEEFPPPPIILLDKDFELDDGGFTAIDHSVDDAGSDWMWDAPSSDGGQGGGAITGGAGTPPSAKCWGTDTGDPGTYVTGTDTSLISPIINLIGVSGATLSFAQAIDILSPDVLTVNIIEADISGGVSTVGSPIHTADDTGTIDEADWQQVSGLDLAEGVGKQVRIEWRFKGDATDGTYIGAYIDDVTVTAAP